MAAPDWSNTTQQLLKTSQYPNNTEYSFGTIRAAIGDTSKPISASELYRVTDIDAPYNYPAHPTASTPHLPYILDAVENVGVPTSWCYISSRCKECNKRVCCRTRPKCN